MTGSPRPPAADTPLRLLIAEDEPIVRAGLRMLLAAEHDLEVVAEAADGQQAVQQASQCQPDIVLMDIRMPVMDGIDATRRIRNQPGATPAVLILTTFATDDNLLEALRAGANGFVLKRAEVADIAHAIRTVATSGNLVLPDATRHLLTKSAVARPELAPALARLTGREREVLHLMASGLSNNEIGNELFLSTQTVKTHVAAILAKLNCRDRTQAVIAAYDSGFLN